MRNKRKDPHRKPTSSTREKTSYKEIFLRLPSGEKKKEERGSRLSWATGSNRSWSFKNRRKPGGRHLRVPGEGTVKN